MFTEKFDINRDFLSLAALEILRKDGALSPCLLQRRLKVSYQKALEICKMLSNKPGVASRESGNGSLILKLEFSDKIIQIDFCRHKYLSRKASELAMRTFWNNSSVHLNFTFKHLNVKQI